MICYVYQSPSSLSLYLSRANFVAIVVTASKDFPVLAEFLNSKFPQQRVVLIDGIKLVKSFENMVKYKKLLSCAHIVVCDTVANLMAADITPDDAEPIKRGMWKPKNVARFPERFNRALHKDALGL